MRLYILFFSLILLRACVDNAPLEEKIGDTSDLKWLSGGEFVVLLEETVVRTNDVFRSFMLVIRDQYTWPTVQIVDSFTNRPNKIFFVNDQLITLNGGGQMGTVKQDWLLEWKTTQPSGFQLNSIAYGDGGYIAVGGDGIVLRNDNATNFDSWVVHTSGTSYNMQTVVYGNGKFIMAGESTNLYISEDKGNTWQLKEIDYGDHDILTNFPSGNIQAGIYQEGVFIFVGIDSLILLSKDDGKTWSIVELHENLEEVDFFDIAYGAGKFIVVGGDSGTDYSGTTDRTNSFDQTVPPAIIMISENGGATWTEERLPEEEEYTGVLHGVAYREANATVHGSGRYKTNEQMIIAVGTHRGILYNTDDEDQWLIMGMGNLFDGIGGNHPYRNRREPDELRSENTAYNRGGANDSFLSIDVYR